MSGTRTSATPPGALTGAGGAATDGKAAGDGAAVPAPSPASKAITLPALTVSPILTRISLTPPAAGAGTSIVALSDSNVSRGSSGLTRSPALTCNSITGTSLKSPMSGTFTSTIAPISSSHFFLSCSPRFCCSRVGCESHRPRIRTLGVELVFGNRLGRLGGRQRAVIGERLQCRQHHLMAIDFKEAPQLDAVVAAPEAVRAAHDVTAPVKRHH